MSKCSLKSTRDFTNGPIFFRITAFAIPIMLTGFLQIAYSMADNIIVGKFSNDPLALAAVGSTGSLNSLMINLLLGIATGAGVVVAQFYGARDDDRVSKSVHTAMLIGLFGGLIFSGIALVISRPALLMLGTKSELIDRAVLYFRIICLGIPANSVYNYGAAILRGTGNSRAPLIILGSAGIINVLLNLFFVIACGMSVSGVAIATVASQVISAVAVVIVLMRSTGKPFRLYLSRLKLEKGYLLRILRFGVPSGIQSSMFSIANVFMTSAVNTFPTTTITGVTIASNVDALTLTSMNCFGSACMTFTGQNYGAKKPDRIKKILIYSIIQTVIVGAAVGALELTFSDALISLYMSEEVVEKEAVIAAAKTVMRVILICYPIYGVLDSGSAAIKGLGYTFTAMIMSLVGICVMRIIWITVFFPMIGTLFALYLSYPITWTLTSITSIVIFSVVFGKFKRSLTAKDAEIEI